MQGVKIVARFFKSPKMSAFLYNCALSRCEDVGGFPGFRQIKIRAFPQSSKKGDGRAAAEDARSPFFKTPKKKEEKKRKKRLRLSPSAKWRKKVADRKAAERYPRRFRSLRSPTLYRNKPHIPYFDRYRSCSDLSYKIKYFFQEGKKNPVFSPLSVIFTCIFITYIV